MITQDPELSVLKFAPWKGATVFLRFGFLVGSQVVGQMLGHFETFVTTFISALKAPY